MQIWKQRRGGGGFIFRALDKELGTVPSACRLICSRRSRGRTRRCSRSSSSPARSCPGCPGCAANGKSPSRTVGMACLWPTRCTSSAGLRGGSFRGNSFFLSSTATLGRTIDYRDMSTDAKKKMKNYNVKTALVGNTLHKFSMVSHSLLHHSSAVLEELQITKFVPIT